jgi:excisionase family DNA binding protein
MSSAYYTTRELQELLHIDRTTIYRMADAGRLPGMKIGNQWRFPRRRIDQWLARESDAEVPPHANPDAPADAPSTLAALLPVDCVQLIQDSFADAIGVMIVITDLQGRPVTRSSNAPGFVRAIEAQPHAYAHCLAWWAALTRRPGLQPAWVESSAGLLCTRAFIRVGSELVGMVVFGGVAPQQWPPAPDEIARIACELDMEAGEIEATIGEVHVASNGDGERMLDFVQRVADIVTHILGERMQLLATPAATFYANGN